MIALTINLGLSFGHVHEIPGRVAYGAENASFLSAPSPNDGLPSGQTDNDLCPICMAMSEMANAITAPPPILSVEFSVVSIDYAITSTTDVWPAHRSVFHSRGPPIA
ncbi:MAG: hypothetical protein J0I16_03205 [Rhizobiales bacterium]|nr:hypothetical protein [Hyphomicrobiales bacterium]